MDMCNCLKMPLSQIKKLLAGLIVFTGLSFSLQAATYTNPTTSENWTSADTIILNDGYSLTLNNTDTTISITTLRITGANTVTLDLNNHTLEILNHLDIGIDNEASGAGHLCLKNGTIIIKDTGYFDECDAGQNSLQLVNATCKVEGTLYCNGTGTTTITGDENSHFYAPASYDDYNNSSQSVISFPGTLQPITLSEGYTCNISRTPVPGALIQLTVTNETTIFNQLQYTVKIINGSGEAYTINETSVSSSIDSIQPINFEEGNITQSFYIQFPASIPQNHGIEFKLFDTTGTLELYTIYYTQQSSQTIWTGNAVDGESNPDNSWTSADNWSDGVPSAGMDVIIPDIAENTNPNNYPKLITATANFRIITINENAQVNISSNGNLKSSTVINNGTITVDGGTITASTALTNNGTINFKGNFTDSGAYSGTGKIIFNGITDQNFTPNINNTYKEIEENKTSGSLNIQSNLKAEKLTITSGNITFAGNAEIASNFTIPSSSEFTASSGTITFKAGLNLAGSFEANNGTIKLTAENKGSEDFVTLAGSHTFNNLTITGNVYITGSNTFNTLSAENLEDKTIKFKAGTTQTITNSLKLSGKSTGADTYSILTLISDSDDDWNIVCNNTNAELQYLSVKNSNSTYSLIANNITDGTGNTNWIFPGMEYTWTGNDSIVWANIENWSPKSIPGNGAIIIIPADPSGNKYPTIENGTIAVDSIENNGEITITGGTITTETQFLNNNQITISGSPFINPSALTKNQNADTSTIVYSGTGTTAPAWGNTYNNLEVTNDTTVTFASDTQIQVHLTNNGTITNNAELSVNKLTSSGIINGTGNQNYTGEITLSGNTTLSSSDNSGPTGTISISSTINGTTDGSQALTITATETTFDGIIGGQKKLSSLSVTGIANIKTSVIATTGNQIYSGNVILDSNEVTFSTQTTSAEIDFSGNISGSGKKLIISSPTFKSTAEVANPSSPPTVTVQCNELTFSQDTKIQSTNGAPIQFTVPTFSGSGKTVSVESGSKLSFVGNISIEPTIITKTGSKLTAPSVASGVNSYTMTFKSSINFAAETFTHSNGTVILAPNTLSSITVSGESTFYNLTAQNLTGKTIKFEAGKTQTINGKLTLSGASSTNKLLLCSSSNNSPWTIKCTGTNNHQIQYVDIKDSSNTSNTSNTPTTAYNLFAINSTDNGNNTNWNFPDNKYKWKGGSGDTEATKTNWNDPDNWEQDTDTPTWQKGSIPGVGAIITIPGSLSNYPKLTQELNLNASYGSPAQTYNGTITISEYATFDLSDQNLTVGTITNNGLVRLKGTQTITGVMKNGADGTKGTVEYYYDNTDSPLTPLTTFVWDGNNAATASGKQYANLVIKRPVNQSNSAEEKIEVSGTTEIAAGDNNEVTLNNSSNSFNGIKIGNSAVTPKVNAGIVTLNADRAISFDDYAYANNITCNCNAKIKNIEVTDSVTFEKTVTLLSATKITSATGEKLHFKDTVSGSYPLETETGSVKFDKDITELTSLTTAATATFATDANINVGSLSTQVAIINCATVETTANTQNSQTYNGAVTIGSAPGTTFIAPEGKLIYFKNTVTGNELNTLTTSTANSQFDGVISNITSLITDATATFNDNITVTTIDAKTVNINCDEVTTTTGSQIYRGPVVSKAHEITSGSTLTFKDELEIHETSQPAQIIASNAIFEKAVTINGDTTIIAGVTESETILFQDEITGDGNHSLETQTGSVHFEKSITGLTALTTDANATFDDTVDVGTLQTQAATIYCDTITTTGNQTYNGSVTIHNPAELSSGDTISFNNSLTLYADTTLSANEKINYKTNITDNVTGSTNRKTLTIDSPIFNSTAAAATSVAITLGELAFVQDETSLETTNNTTVNLNAASIDGVGNTIVVDQSLSNFAMTHDSVVVEPNIKTESGSKFTAASGTTTFNGDVDFANNTLEANNGTIIITADNKSNGTEALLKGNNIFNNLTLIGKVTVAGSNTINETLLITSINPVKFESDNTIHNFKAGDETTGLGGKTITFGAGKTQTVTGNLQLMGSLDSNRLQLRSSVDGSTWKINCTGTNEHTIQYVDIQDSDNDSTYKLFALNSNDSGNNINWNFPEMQYTWIGTSSSDWNTKENWSPASIPNKGAVVTIPTVETNYPILTRSLDLNDSYNSTAYNGTITVAENAQFDLSGENLTVGTITNNGLVRLTGTTDQTISGIMINGNGSTVEYYDDTGIATSTNFAWDGEGSTSRAGKQYEKLHINASVNISEKITANNTTSITAGTGKTVTLNNAGNIFTGNVMLGNSESVTPVNAGAVTLNSSSPITLDDNANADSFICNCPIKLKNITTNGNQTYNGPVTLLDSATFKTTDDSSLITLNASLQGDTTSGKSLTVHSALKLVSGCTNIQQLDAATFKKSVEVLGNTKITTATGDTILFNDEITGNGSLETIKGSVKFDDTITGLTSLKTAATATFNDDVNIGTLNTQIAKINCSSITANRATFEDLVTLLSNTAITTDAAETPKLIFKKEVSGSGSYSLETINGSVIFEDEINDLVALTTDTTSTFNGNITIGTLDTQIAKINCASITTTGNQTYNDEVTLSYNGDVTQTAKNNSTVFQTVQFNRNVVKANTGTHNLIVDAETKINCEAISVNSAKFNQPVTLLHDTTITTDSADTAKLIFEKSLSSENETSHSLTTVTGSVDFKDTIIELSSLTTAATATFYGNVNVGTLNTNIANINCPSITTTENQNYHGAVSVLHDTELLSSTGNIDFDSTIDGNYLLKLSVLNNSSNTISVAGKVGASTEITNPPSITIEQAGNVTFGETVNTQNFIVIQAVSTTFENEVQISTFKDASTSGAISFKKGGVISSITDGILNTIGTVSFGDDIQATTTINSAISHTKGATEINGNLTATDNNITFGDTTLTGSLNGKDISLNQTSGRDMSLTGQNITLNGDLTSEVAVKITNSGLFKTEDTKALSYSTSFTQDGTGNSMLGGNFIGTGNATFNTSVYLYGSANANFGSDTIAINGEQSNLIIARDATADLNIQASSVTADNIVFYSGDVTTNGNINSRKDIVILGQQYSTLDSSTGIEDEYSYSANRPAGWKNANYTFESAFPDGTALPDSTAFDTRLTVASGKKIIHVGENFYTNGASLTGSAEWFIDILSNADSTVCFAEAYNSEITNCTVRCQTSNSPAQIPAENCDLTNCKNFDYAEFTIDEVYTTRDNVVYVKFNREVRNLNDELLGAISQFKYFHDSANDTSYDSIATNDAGSTLLVSGTEPTSIYLVAATDKTWNTDATGKDSGKSISTDRYDNHKNAKPYIDIPRALGSSATASQNAVITDRFGKRLKNYSTRTPTAGFAYGTDETAGNETYVLDKTGPVLVQVRTGQETHETSLANQKAYDAHNFIEFIYSEAVNFGSHTDANDSTKLNKDWIPAYNSGLPNTPQNIQVTSSLGFTENEPLTFNGLNQQIATGKIITKQTSTQTNNVNAFYRQSTHSIKYSLAGFASNVDEEGNISGTYISWPGYIDSETSLPQGTVTLTSTASFVTDCATNPDGTIPLYNNQIMNKPGLQVNNTEEVGTCYGDWDLQPPVFVKAHKKGNDDNENYYEAIGNGDGSTLNRIEIHIADNPSSLTNGISKNRLWLTRYGWAASINPTTALSAAADKLIGGARPYATSDKTSGGLRYCTILNQKTAFQYSDKITLSPNKEFTAIAPGASASYFVSSTDNRNEIPTDKDNTYINLELSDTNLPYETSFTISYNDSDSYITDLAGNRLRSPTEGVMNTVDRTPPDFKIAFAPIGSNKLLLIFVKKLSNDIQYSQKNSDGEYEEMHITDFDQIIPYCFDIGKITNNSFESNSSSDLQIKTSAPARRIESCSNDYYTAIELTLTKAVTLEDVKNCYIRLKEVDNDHIKSKDILTNLEDSYVSFIQDEIGNYMQMYQAHALSDFASGIIDPLYAYNNDLEYNAENITENLYSSGSWAIHDWNEEQQNYGTLIAQKPVTLIANVEEPDLSLRMYFSTPTPETGSQSEKFNSDIPENKLRLWMPTIENSYENGLFPAYSEKTNSNFRFTDGVQSTENDKQFSFEINQEDSQTFTSGKQISLLFGLFDSTGNQEQICLSPILTFNSGNASYDIANKVPLYLVRLKDPSQITSIDLWSFKVKDIKSQRGNVTILNNVINATNGEKTVVKVDVPAEGRLNVIVMTLDGNIITYLHRGNAKAGENYFTWDGKNRNGSLVARGMYFIRVVGSDFDETRKVMVVK